MPKDVHDTCPWTPADYFAPVVRSTRAWVSNCYGLPFGRVGVSGDFFNHRLWLLEPLRGNLEGGAKGLNRRGVSSVGALVKGYSGPPRH